MKRCAIGPLVVLMFVVAASAQTPLALDQKVASVLPSDDEWRWMQIPWRTNVMQALAEAGRANKPVFLWVMNGNPVGCG